MLKLQEAVLPAASVAVQVTCVVPAGKVEPDGGSQLIVTPGQLSVADAANVTVASQLLLSLSTSMSAGHEMIGFSSSSTKTSNEQLVVRPTASLAVQLTVVSPKLKSAPEGGTQENVTPGQLSLA